MAYTQDNFDWQGYMAANPGIQQGDKADKDHEGARAWADYQSKGGTWLNAADSAAKAKADATYTPGADVNPANATSYAGQLVPDNPDNFISGANGTSAVQATQGQTGTAAQVDGNDPKLGLGNTPTVTNTNIDQVDPTAAHDYDVTKTEDKVKDNQMEAAQGTVSDKAQIKDVPPADTTGIATGTNKDGTKNELGTALQQYAHQDMSNVIDTSTAAGKLLAQQLGDGNYVDSKATLEGQLAILQQQFVDPNTGEPKIPSWAAATARNVSKIAAFGGMTGTAATAAMSQALLEASLPIAQSDATFFQTLTVKNLDNKQQSTINAANVLAKFEQTNLDNRMTAAVQNAQSFLAMDLKNLDNEQQANVINNQARIQSILTDANAQNVKDQFMAQSQNDVDKFYASLNTQISQFNSSQTLDADKFNSTMEDSRQKFYSDQQYNIAVANANWRQQIQLQDDQQNFEAATTDVKNNVDISTAALNQLWDRSDALLDYAFKSSESQKDRDAAVAMAKLQIKASTKGANMAALGSIAGAFVGSDSFTSMMSGIFS